MADDYRADMPEGSLGRSIYELEKRAKELGASDVLASADQLNARLRDERDRVLFGGDGEGNEN